MVVSLGLLFGFFFRKNYLTAFQASDDLVTWLAHSLTCFFDWRLCFLLLAFLFCVRMDSATAGTANSLGVGSCSSSDSDPNESESRSLSRWIASFCWARSALSRAASACRLHCRISLTCGSLALIHSHKRCSIACRTAVWMCNPWLINGKFKNFLTYTKRLKKTNAHIINHFHAKLRYFGRSSVVVIGRSSDFICRCAADWATAEGHDRDPVWNFVSAGDQSVEVLKFRRLTRSFFRKAQDRFRRGHFKEA